MFRLLIGEEEELDLTTEPTQSAVRALKCPDLLTHRWKVSVLHELPACCDLTTHQQILNVLIEHVIKMFPTCSVWDQVRSLDLGAGLPSELMTPVRQSHLAASLKIHRPSSNKGFITSQPHCWIASRVRQCFSLAEDKDLIFHPKT